MSAASVIHDGNLQCRQVAEDTEATQIRQERFAFRQTWAQAKISLGTITGPLAVGGEVLQVVDLVEVKTKLSAKLSILTEDYCANSARIVQFSADLDQPAERTRVDKLPVASKGGRTSIKRSVKLFEVVNLPLLSPHEWVVRQIVR